MEILEERFRYFEFYVFIGSFNFDIWLALTRTPQTVRLTFFAS